MGENAQRPMFKRPDPPEVRGPDGLYLKEFVDPPSPGEVLVIRAFSGVIAVIVAAGAVMAIVDQNIVWLLPAVFAFVAYPSRGPGWLPDSWKTTMRYWLHYSWRGERAKPERLITEREADYKRNTYADEMAREALPGWIRAGLSDGSAPRADYEPRFTRFADRIELTVQDVDGVCMALGWPGGGLARGLARAPDPREHRAQLDRLIEAGILRRTALEVPSARSARFFGPGNAELVPEQVGLLGVALCAEHVVLVQWPEGPAWHDFQCAAVPGRMVVVEDDRSDKGPVRTGGGPETRLRFSAMSASAVVERVVDAAQWSTGETEDHYLWLKRPGDGSQWRVSRPEGDTVKVGASTRGGWKHHSLSVDEFRRLVRDVIEAPKPDRE